MSNNTNKSFKQSRNFSFTHKASKPNNNDNRKVYNNNSKLINANKQKKVGINSRNENAKYTDEEIKKARYLDSKAKFLVRDRIHNDNIDTRNKWISISNLETKDRFDIDGVYAPDILSFDAEIFDRTEYPHYTEDMNDDEKHHLTYVVAEGDIKKQRKSERYKNQKIVRPSYHVEVTTKHTQKGKAEYQIKKIQRIK